MITAVFVKGIKSEYATYIALAGAVIIISFSALKLQQIITAVNMIQNKMGLSTNYISLLIRIVGVAYVCDFSADLCKDSGHTTISNQLQIFGKLTVLTMSMPVFFELIDIIGGML